MFFLFYFFSIFVYYSSATNKVPPKIIVKWERNLYFEKTRSLTFNCSSLGSLPINYEFFKDDKLLRSQSDPIYFLSSLSEINNGYYHCQAQNEFGVSISEKSQVQMATEVIFTKIDMIKIVEFKTSKLKIDCKPRFSVIPSVDYTWFESGKPVFNSNEVQIGENGTLFIASLENFFKSDSLSFYCVANNSFTKQAAESGKTIIRETRFSENFPPSSFTWTGQPNNQVVFLEGQVLILRCLFSGSPIPKITWFKNSEPLPNSNWDRRFGDTIVVYKGSVSKNMTGTYRCDGENSQDKTSQTMDILIESKPSFLNTNSKPKDLIVAEGETAQITCDPQGEPHPQINWFKNGILIDITKPPDKYVFSQDQTELNITNICKTCNQPDFGVIQCFLKNKHGTTFAEGTIIPIEATKINENNSKMEDVFWEPFKNITFRMEVFADPSLPLFYKWCFNQTQIHPNQDPNLIISADQKELTLAIGQNEDDGESKLGIYECLVTNNYSQVYRKAKVSKNNSTVNIEKRWWWWWIFLLSLFIFLIFLTLLFLLLYFMGCMKNCCRMDEEHYPVDKIDRSRGIDHAKELNTLDRKNVSANFNMGFGNDNFHSLEYSPSLQQKITKDYNINNEFNNIRYTDTNIIYPPNILHRISSTNDLISCPGTPKKVRVIKKEGQIKENSCSHFQNSFPYFIYDNNDIGNYGNYVERNFKSEGFEQSFNKNFYTNQE